MYLKTLGDLPNYVKTPIIYSLTHFTKYSSSILYTVFYRVYKIYQNSNFSELNVRYLMFNI